MRIKTLLILPIILLMAIKVEAKGGIPIIYSSGDNVVKIMDLPYEDEFTIQCGDGEWHHADLGIYHQQFSVLGIPLYNYGKERYVLYTDIKIGEYDFTYADLSKDDIDYLRERFTDISEEPVLPFWHLLGGKLLALLIIGFFVIRRLLKED